jgi:uncharacterized protein YlxP (DUF503 family)
MVIGVVRMKLVVRGSRSLKEKRRAVKSLKDRIASRLNVSVAEVDYLDDWQLTELGAAVCSTSRKHADRMLDAVVKMGRAGGPAELVDYTTELFHV